MTQREVRKRVFDAIVSLSEVESWLADRDDSRDNQPGHEELDVTKEKGREAALLKIRVDLLDIDNRLEQMCRHLPRPTETFDAQGELRGALECVRADLLQDAISTLGIVSRRGDEAEWRDAFAHRVQLLQWRLGGC